MTEQICMSNNFSDFLMKRGFIKILEDSPSGRIYIETPGKVEIYCKGGDHWLETSIEELMDPDWCYIYDDKCQVNHILGMSAEKVKELIKSGKIRKAAEESA